MKKEILQKARNIKTPMKKLLFLLLIMLFTFSCSQKKPDWINNTPPNPIEQNRLDKYQLRTKRWHISEILGSDVENNQEFVFLKLIQLTGIILHMVRQ